MTVYRWELSKAQIREWLDLPEDVDMEMSVEEDCIVFYWRKKHGY